MIQSGQQLDAQCLLTSRDGHQGVGSTPGDHLRDALARARELTSTVMIALVRVSAGLPVVAAGLEGSSSSDRTCRRHRDPRRRPGVSALRGDSRVARQSVVGDRLPRRGIGDELANARADPGIVIEGAHTDADRIGAWDESGSRLGDGKRLAIRQSRDPRRQSQSAGKRAGTGHPSVATALARCVPAEAKAIAVVGGPDERTYTLRSLPPHAGAHRPGRLTPRVSPSGSGEPLAQARASADSAANSSSSPRVSTSRSGLEARSALTPNTSSPS